MRLYVFLTTILLVILSSTGAEELRFTRVDERYGLKQGSVDVLIQDNFGFVWIGTEDGLSRFDGKQVTVYRNDPDDITSLPDNVVTALMSSSAGKLWVGTEADGLSFYDYKKDSFVRLSMTQIGKRVFSIYQGNESFSEVFIRTDKGLFGINQTLSVDKLLDEELSSQLIGVFGTDFARYALLANGKKVDLANPSQVILDESLEGIDIRQVWEGAICPLVVLDKSNIFYCPDDKAHRINQLAYRLIEEGLDTNTLRFNDFLEQDDGTIWLSSNKGLIKVTSERVTISRNIPNDTHSLSSSKTRPLLLGKNQKLFVGTATKGLNVLNLNTKGILSLRTTNSSVHLKNQGKFEVQNLKSCGFNESDYNTVWTIMKASDGDIWVGNYSGLAVKPSGSDRFVDFSRIGTAEENIAVCSVWSLAEANGLLWFGTWNGLLSFDKESRAVTIYKAQTTDMKIPVNRTLSGNAIRVLQFDEQRNSLWVGTNGNSLNRIDFATGKVHQYLADANDPSKLPHPRVRSIFLDNKNRVWIGTGGGLSLWNEADNTFRTINSGVIKTQLSDEDVRAIYQLDDQHLWVGTGNGLNLFNIDQFEVHKRLSEKGGLANSTIYSLVPDDQGALWISTANGLSRFDPQQLTFSNFYVSQGLQANEFNFNAWHKDAEGLIYFGGVNGLNVIDPEKIKTERNRVGPVFTVVSAYDQAGQQYSLGKMLSHHSDASINTEYRHLSIEYSAVSYDSIEKAGSGDIQHRLLPAFPAWVVDDSLSHYTEYTNLKPGDYIFELSTPDDPSPAARLNFTIQAHFWETLWFKILSGLILFCLTIILGMYLYKARLRRLIDKRTSQHYRIVEHELRPHLHEVNKQIDRLAEAQDLPEKYRLALSTAVKPILEKSIGFIQDLRSLIDAQHAEKQRKDWYMLEDIVDEVQLYFNESSDQITIIPFDDINVFIYENSIYLILKNLIANALNYSESDSEVVVSFTCEGSNLLIRCADRGIGINPKKREAVYAPYTRLDGELGNVKGLGIGLTIVRFIVNSYGGTIEISDNQPHGTIFSVVLRGVAEND